MIIFKARYIFLKIEVNFCPALTKLALTVLDIFHFAVFYLMFFISSPPPLNQMSIECSDKKFSFKKLFRAPKLVIFPRLRQIGKPNSFKSKYAFSGAVQKNVTNSVKSPKGRGHQHQKSKTSQFNM